MFCAVAIVAAAADASKLPDRPSLVAALKAADRAWNTRNWKALWALYGPRFRSTCTYGDWLRNIKAERELLGRISGELLRVRLVGAKAYVDLTSTAESGDSARFANDLYVWINGHWYDELDSQTPCS